MTKKLILPLYVQVALEQQAAENAPVEQVLACGGCGTNKFRVVVGGDLVCANCNEIVAGFKVWPEDGIPVLIDHDQNPS
jgi:hypothetical protein